MATSNTTESVLRIRAENATGAALQRISNDLNRLGRETERAGGQSIKMGSQIQRMLGGLTGFQRQLGAAAASFGTGLLTRKSVTEFADLERSIQNLHHTMGLGNQGLDQTREKIFQLALATGQSANDVVSAYNTIAAAGDETPDGIDKIAQAAARASLAMNGNIDSVAKMAVLWKQAGNDGDGVTRMLNRVTSASQRGRFEGKDFADNFEKIGTSMELAGYKGDEGLSKMLALLTVTRRGATDSAGAVDNLRDVIIKMTSEETYNKMKDLGINWNKNVVQNIRKSGGDVLMSFLKTVLEAQERAKRNGKPFNISEIFGDIQAMQGANSILNVKNFADLLRLFDEFRNDPLTINDKQFQDKMAQAKVALQNFETAFYKLRVSIGAGLVDAGVLDALGKFSQLLLTAATGAERLGRVVKAFREGDGGQALGQEIRDNAESLMHRRSDSQSQSTIADLQQRREGATPSQQAYIDRQIEEISREAREAARGYNALPSPVPFGDPRTMRMPGRGAPQGRLGFGGPVDTGAVGGRIRLSNPSDLGTATEGTAREQLDEQRKTNEEIGRLLMQKISYGGSAGDAGGGTGGGSASGGRSYGGGRFNGLGGAPRGGGGGLGGGSRGGGSRGGGGDLGADAGTGVGGGGESVNPILNAISRAEGTTKLGYNDSFAHQNKVDYSGMTLNQIEQLQRRMKGSSAIGRYQFMRSTLFGEKGRPGLVDELGIDRNEKFTPAMQERLGGALLNRRGYQKWLRGEITDAQFQTNLSKEWAGVSSANGRGSYEGYGLNGRVRDNRGSFNQAFGAARAGAKGVGVASPAEAPTPPPRPAALDQPPEAVKIPVTFDYQGVDMPSIRDRGAAQARREMQRDMKQQRYTSYSDVGVA